MLGNECQIASPTLHLPSTALSNCLYILNCTESQTCNGVFVKPLVEHLLVYPILVITVFGAITLYGNLITHLGTKLYKSQHQSNKLGPWPT